MINENLFTSQSDEWATPQKIFDELNEEFEFDLDPCATSENHKCKRFYTIENDGLSQKWGGAGCSAIHLIRRLQSGLRKRSGKRERITHLLYY